MPLVAAVLLATAGAAISTLSASAHDSLAPRSAAQLLVDVQKAKVEGLSGTVVQTADLGLPALPNVAGGSSSDFTALVSGSHTLRLWYAGPTKARLALLGDLGESDLIRNGSGRLALVEQHQHRQARQRPRVDRDPRPAPRPRRRPRRHLSRQPTWPWRRSRRPPA